MNSPKDCLIITRRDPLACPGGDSRRVLEYMKIMQQAGFKTHIVCYGKQDTTTLNSDTSIHTVRFSYFWALINTIFAILMGYPIQTRMFIQPRFKRLLIKLSKEKNFSIKICHLVRFAEMVPKTDRCHWHLEMTDSISLNYYRFAKFSFNLWSLICLFERRKLLAYEKTVVNDFRSATMISASDWRFLDCPPNVAVIPNSLLTPQSGAATRLAFSGNFKSQANLRGAKFLLDEVRPALARMTNKPFRFVFIGSNAEAIFPLCKKIQNFEIHSYPEDIIQTIKTNSDILICPVDSCAGLQNKILDAIQAQIPIVASPDSASPYFDFLGEEFQKVCKIPSSHQADKYAAKIVEWLDEKKHDKVTFDRVLSKFSEQNIASLFRNSLSI